MVEPRVSRRGRHVVSPVRVTWFSAGEKLPWSLKLRDASVYTTQRGAADNSGSCHDLLAPTGLSCTVAVTTKYQPPTSDAIAALGVVLHADMDAVELRLRKEQVRGVT